MADDLFDDSGGDEHPQSVRYYAYLVECYTVYKLKRMDREAVHLHLLCFIHDRYQRRNDKRLGRRYRYLSRWTDTANETGKPRREAGLPGTQPTPTGCTRKTWNWMERRLHSRISMTPRIPMPSALCFC